MKKVLSGAMLDGIPRISCIKLHVCVNWILNLNSLFIVVLPVRLKGNLYTSYGGNSVEIAFAFLLKRGLL